MDTANHSGTMALPIPDMHLPGAVGPLGPVVPAAPGEVLPAPPPRSYREIYSDAANNPTLARTVGYLSGYRFSEVAGGAGVPNPATLRDQTTALSDRR